MNVKSLENVYEIFLPLKLMKIVSYEKLPALKSYIKKTITAIPLLEGGRGIVVNSLTPTRGFEKVPGKNLCVYVCRFRVWLCMSKW